MTKRQFGFRLKDVPSVGGTAFGLAYGTGVLIVSVRLSEFGIAEFTLFKAHILAAGSLFLLLTFVSCLASLRIQGLLGLSSFSVPASKPVLHLNWWRIYNSFLFYQMAVGIALVTRFILAGEPDNPSFELRVLGIPAALGFILAILSKYVFDRFPVLFTCCSIVIALVTLGAVLLHSGRGLFWLSSWYYFVGSGFVFAYRTAKDSSLRRYFEWEWLPFLIVFSIVWYSLRIYPTLKPEFGGGAPTTVEITFTSQGSVHMPASQEMQLIDETEQGYYILVPQADKKYVYFVPRKLVDTVKFK